MEQLLALPTYYLVIGGIGVAALIISILFGDLLDALDTPLEVLDGWLSMHAIAASMAFFGLSGLLFSGSLPELVAIILAIIVSVAVFVAVALLMRFIHRQQGSTSYTRDSFRAEQGIVTQRIPAERTGSGEIQIEVPGSGIVTLEAYTSTSIPLPVGTKIVIHRVEPRMVHVIPLDDPEMETFNA